MGPYLVFSSTCASYGIPDSDQIPIAEGCPQRPINPYGRSKAMVEQAITDFGSAYGLPSVIFRYFNAAGADPAADLGEQHNPETHLIPLLLDVMLGRKPYLQIFGDDYPTPDGTCIRDYIHVADLADAHVLGLQKLLADGGQHVFNLGNGTGYSVQQVIDVAKAVTGGRWRPTWCSAVLAIPRCWWHPPRKPTRSWAGSRVIPSFTRSWITLGPGTNVFIRTNSMPASSPATCHRWCRIPWFPPDRSPDGGW